MFNWLRSLGHAISNLFTSAVDFETGIYTAFFSMEDDTKAFIAQLSGFKHFEFDPKWKTRVINVPRAYAGINELFDILMHGLLDKFKALGESVTTLVNVIKSDSGRPVPDDGGPGVAAVQEKMATIKLAVTDLQTAFHLALDIEQTLLDLKQRAESLDDLFLPAGRTKTAVTVHYRKRTG